MTGGPQFYTHAERMKRVEEIAGQLRAYFGPRLLALGLYGSVARGTDGPYSDIELYAIIQGEGVDYAYEWSAGPWSTQSARRVKIYHRAHRVHREFKEGFSLCSSRSLR